MTSVLKKNSKKTPSNCRSKTEEKITLMLKYILMFELLQCLNCHLYFCTVFSYLSLISVICSITLTWSFSQISILHSFHLAYLSFTCLSLFHSSLLKYDRVDSCNLTNILYFQIHIFSWTFERSCCQAWISQM